MKILWITNILFSDPCKALGLNSPVVGGWMYASAKALLENCSDIQLSVATVYNGKCFKRLIINNIWYYLLPLKGDNTMYYSELENEWKKVLEDFSPDLVHLHGTEFAHGLAFLNACPNIKSVVSIQGLVSVYERYYYSGLSFADIWKNITFRDIVKRDNIFQQKRKFYKRGLIEREIISKTKHVIGRTSWDKAHVLAINPNVIYHFCNETLRDEFYLHQWSYDKCEKHSIFLSQAGYPIKGLHQVIKALPFILKKYPGIKIYVAGADITNNSTLKNRLKRSGYGKYIKHLLSKYHLVDKVFFLGFLNEQQICERYLESNLFICPSSIENSPNSLAEAQLLGVPCVASYVGGIPDMMKGYEENLYRFEEIEMLVETVNNVFENQQCVSVNSDFKSKYSTVENAKIIYNIYCDIIDFA